MLMRLLKMPKVKKIQMIESKVSNFKIFFLKCAEKKLRISTWVGNRSYIFSGSHPS